MELGMKRLSRNYFAVLVFVGASLSSYSGEPSRQNAIAIYAPDIKLEKGVLDSSWDKAPSYRLQAAQPGGWGGDITRISGMDGKVLEGGYVKFLWNEKYLYVGLKMDDSDVVGEAEVDQGRLYAQGDTVEVFIHPRNQTYYWEIFGAVNEKKTCYFFPGRGRVSLDSNHHYQCHGLKVKTTVDGTLNNWHDRDKSWSIIIAVPTSALTEFGASFNNSEFWSIQIVRVNYSRYLPVWETTVFPQNNSGNPHLYEAYACLKLQH